MINIFGYLFENLFNILVFALLFVTALITLKKIGSIKNSSYSHLLMEIYKIWDSKSLRIARNLIKREDDKNTFTSSMARWHKESDEKYFEVIQILNFLEHIAHLVYKKYLKSKDIKDLMGPSVKYYYDVFEKHIEAYGNTAEDGKTFGSRLKELYDEM